MALARTSLAVSLAAILAGCSLSDSGPRYDSGLEGLDLTTVDPGVVLPGTTLVVSGRSFVDTPFGDSNLVLRGSFDDGSGDREVAVTVPLTFVDFEHMQALIGEDFVSQLGARAGDFHGNATIEVASKVDQQLHTTRTLGLSLSVREQLSPTIATLANGSVIYVNDAIELTGDGLLLGGDEGTTYAVVEGCFARAGGSCDAVGPVQVPVTPAAPFDRQHGSFPFVPAISGIHAGQFQGTVALENQHGGGAVVSSATRDTSYEVIEAAVLGGGPGAVSLGQYLEIKGGGFIGGASDQLTLLHVDGTYTPARGGGAVAIDTILVPEFVDGHTVRYVINEDDDLGRLVKPRGDGGDFDGEVAPLVSYGNDDVAGAPFPVRLTVAPVKQVVYLHFTTQYVISLQSFGLRALDEQLRERIAAVVERDYRTVNLEVRLDEPTDFATYAEVELGGPDPNGLSLLGYDNTPGKDVGNVRLYDRIGGVNALTQEDGFPGFGGVFVESLFIFSEHPGDFVATSAGADPLFDDIFDPFRPDRDGSPVRAADLSGNPDLSLDDASACPAQDRQGRIACAVFVLGSLIGTTVSHELGHSLGLANPDRPDDPHLFGDEPNRLMESGSGRSFRERAQLGGEGPAMFCDQEYAYLRAILPSTEAADPTLRPDCL